MQRISHTSRLVLVVLAILVCQGAVGQFDDGGDGFCCPRGYLDSSVYAAFEPGTTREHVEEVAAELGLHVNRVYLGSWWTLASFCAPVGEEQAFVDTLEALPEVLLAGRDSIGCIVDPIRDCECCTCGFDCEAPYPLVLPNCEPGCVLDFDGDIRASAVASMREEITAILTVAKPQDEILLRLESAGGLVYSYGLASSQLQRVREANIPLTIAIDKINPR